MRPALRLQTLDSSIISSIFAQHKAPAACQHRFWQQRQAHTSTNTARRRIHSTKPHDAAVSAPSLPDATANREQPAPPTFPAQSGVASIPGLDCLPLSQILRTYLITTISSSPTLLSASSKILRYMLESKSLLFSLDKNPLARALLWETFYKQFCAGETPSQVAKTYTNLRRQGYSGLILEYALEVLKDAEGADEVQDVVRWRTGMLKTIEMAADGDFVGLKWSGMGPKAMRRMADKLDPSQVMDEAMHAVCSSAAAKNISLLPAAEETWSLDGFQKWTLDKQRVYNRGKVVVYTTYQAYLKQMPNIIVNHLALAKEQNFTLGAKLVRGAYLASEKRELIYPSIEATHEAYNGLMHALIHRRYNETLQPHATASQPKPATAAQTTFPDLNVVIASHNADSVRLAQKWRQEQLATGEALTPLVFAQLQGMADEVSCSLIAAARAGAAQDGVVKEKVFKCTTWGSMTECLNYLLRRAAENKDAASRTKDSRMAMQAAG